MGTEIHVRAQLDWRPNSLDDTKTLYSLASRTACVKFIWGIEVGLNFPVFTAALAEPEITPYHWHISLFANLFSLLGELGG